MVALNRIAVFLDEEEVTDQVSSLKKDNTEHYLPGEYEGLGLENATLRWNTVPEAKEEDKRGTSNQSSPIAITIDVDEISRTEDLVDTLNEDRIFELLDVSVKFPEGKLTVVTGPTASGKSALLVRFFFFFSLTCSDFSQMAVLGEMTLVNGRIIMSKENSRVDENGLMYSISYAAQTPWLRHQSIKDNILFGYPFDQSRYEAVIEACALIPDLDILEDGDETEIGARCVSLSNLRTKLLIIEKGCKSFRWPKG